MPLNYFTEQLKSGIAKAIQMDHLEPVFSAMALNPSLLSEIMRLFEVKEVFCRAIS